MADLVRADFKEEGNYQWVAHKKGYRVVLRRYDGGSEIIIRAELSSDPTHLDWEQALKITNDFYRNLRVASDSDDTTLDINTRD